jgi:hypothetical protein
VGDTIGARNGEPVGDPGGDSIGARNGEPVGTPGGEPNVDSIGALSTGGSTTSGAWLVLEHVVTVDEPSDAAD